MKPITVHMLVLLPWDFGQVIGLVLVVFTGALVLMAAWQWMELVKLRLVCKHEEPEPIMGRIGGIYGKSEGW